MSTIIMAVVVISLLISIDLLVDIPGVDIPDMKDIFEVHQ